MLDIYKSKQIMLFISLEIIDMKYNKEFECIFYYYLCKFIFNRIVIEESYLSNF